MVTLTLAALVLSSAARADVVTFADGRTMAGIVTRQDARVVALQVAEDGFVELPASIVASVDQRGTAENASLKESWRARDAKASAAEEKEKDFTRAQRDKGLVFYEGEWMKPAEVDERLAAERLAGEQRGQHAQAYVTRESVPDLMPRSTVTTSLSFLPFFEPR